MFQTDRAVKTLNVTGIARACDSVVNKTKTKPLCLHLIKSKPEVYVPRVLNALNQADAALGTVAVENANILVLP